MSDQERNRMAGSRPMARGGICLAAAMAALWLSACGGDDPAASQVSDLRSEVQRLRDDQKRLTQQLTDAHAVIENQRRQLLTLQAVGGSERSQYLVTVDHISLATLTGGYDEDGRPGDDGVVAYLQPQDADGDVIKAGGEIQMQVLDLAAPPDSQLVGEGKWTPAEARKAWYGKLMTNHYTLRCPWKNGRRPAHTSLTVRVVFDDVLTGKRFEVQKLVTVRLSP